MNWRDLRAREALRSRLERRAFFVDAIRSFFRDRGFLEVETPYLQPCPNLDYGVDPLRVGSRFLHTSPEYGMKRLLAAGFEAIFQICRVFRDERPGPLHLVEFDMLEWYRCGRDYRWLIEVSWELVSEVAGVFGKHDFSYRDRKASLSGYRIFSIEDFFVEELGASLSELEGLSDIVSFARSLGVAPDEESWENTFHLIYLNLIEPEIARMPVPVYVVDYPARLAAMSALRKEKPWLCERVELLLCGVELMNGYTELVDAKEQRRRLLLEAERRGWGEEVVDGDFIEAVSLMPPAAGAAFGLDRFFMLIEGADSLSEVVFGYDG